MRRYCDGEGRIALYSRHRIGRFFTPRERFWGLAVKGVAMKRFALILCAVLGMAVGQGRALAWCCGGLGYGGQQPWWNCCNKKNKCLSPEEQRLQRFWHDYY